jgi:drug/metabolite transporter (DMT)-like permease
VTIMENNKQVDTAHTIPLGVLYGAGAGALWGLVFLAPELARPFTPLQVAVGRYLAYGILSVLMIAPRWKNLRPTLGKKDWEALFWLSLCGNVFYYIMLSMAVQKGGIALSSLVVGFLPITVTIIGSRDKGAVSFVALLPSLLFCAAGALCVAWQALAVPEAGGHSVSGFFCAVVALVLWTAYAVGNSRCLVRLHTLSVHDWNLLIGIVTGAQALLLTPVAISSGPWTYSTEQFRRFVAVSCGVAVIASIFGNALWNRMSRLVPLTMTGQMILFETFFALIYGFLWEGRWPRLLEGVAFVCITLSVLTCVSVHQKHAARRRGAVSGLMENGV